MKAHPLEDWYLAIQSHETIRRTAPFSLNEDQMRKFNESAHKLNQDKEFSTPETFLACVYGGRIYSPDFLILSKNRDIFFESALSNQSVLERNGIYEKLIWPRLIKKHGSYCLLACPWAVKNYSEWLLGVLPRLSSIERFSELDSVPLLVPKHLTSYQRESLLLAGVTENRLVGFEGGYWQVDALYFPELISPFGNPSPNTVTWLRNRFLKSPENQSSISTRKIYVTRRDASQRRVLNEDQITRYLESIGFEIICPGELSFGEQIKLFSQAEIVIAAHGAASTNMVFAPPNATLIELFGDNYINGVFWAMTNTCNQNYAFLIGPSTWLDYRISLDELKELLDKLSGNRLLSTSVSLTF